MITWIVIVANVLFSLQGFNNRIFFEKNLFQIDPILRGKEYIRLITSTLLHANYIHLGLNMYVFFTFVGMIQTNFSQYGILNVYTGSLIGGNLLALYIHRNHGSYRAVGASGAVSGIVYASILLNPDMGLTLLIFPIASIPGWLFGILYILYTIFGIHKQSGNIGHEAHLGGAIAGLIITILYYPSLLSEQGLLITGMLVPTLVFLFIIVRYPEFRITGKLSKLGKLGRFNKFKLPQSERKKSIRDTENIERAELNRILDKINQRGMNSLSSEERDFLNTYR